MIFLKGDWPYYFPEYLSSFTLPEVWSSVWPTGLGGNQAIILPLKLYLQGVVFLFVNKLGLPWEFIQIVFFFGLFILISVYSSYKLTKSWIGVLVYTTNTWILLVFFGGQMGVALAYAIAPLVLKMFINLIEHTDLTSKNFKFHPDLIGIKLPILAGLILAIQVMFDIRVAFLTMLVFLGYTVFHHFFISKLNIKLFTINYSLLTIIILLLHAFWILPSIFVALKGGNVASIVDTSSGSLEFFSFAKFENSLSLLHPNWPENIFGKVYFMRSEFLILPILVFASLLFIKNSTKSAIDQSNNRTILFFALVGLIGAFLAKGSQEPFGGLFAWLYSNIPGFNLFRDPVKFYILIAIAYSVLIPYSIEQLGKLKKIVPLVFIIFWVYLTLPFITGSNSGIFKSRTVPQEYVRLKNFLVSDNSFARTLWVPQVQRFGFVSDTHPTIATQDLFGYKNTVSQFKKSGTESMLQDMSVKYVIIPYDSEGEIFLNDRKYDDHLYRKTIAELDKISWLKRVGEPGKIVIYQISNPKPHIWSSGDKLIFSESFDSNWYADVGGRKVYSKPFGKLNSFDIAQREQSSITLHYEPQTWATIGYLISGSTMLAVLCAVGISLRKK